MFGGNDLLARTGGEQGSDSSRDRLTVCWISNLGAGVLDQLPKPLGIHSGKECHLTLTSSSPESHHRPEVNLMS
jgi:hypothetical protein